MKLYHMVSRDTSARHHEILKLVIGSIRFHTSGSFQYAEASINGKTGTRHVPLINSIPYIKDYLDHEHPQPTNLEAPFICGQGRSLGKPMPPTEILSIYNDYKKIYFPKLLDSPNVPADDKQKIRELLRKKWNPYVRRHTAITEKSLNPKINPVLDSHAGWVEGSTMRRKYTHYFSNQSNKNILEAYGIIQERDKPGSLLRIKQCTNCSEGNRPEAKFCAKCRMVLTYDSYSETLEKQQEKESEIQRLQAKYEQEMNDMREEFEPLLELKNTLMKEGLLKEPIL